MLRSAVSNPRKYGTLMGLITAVNGGVAGVDSFVGGYFAENFGFRSIFWLMVALALVATVLIAVLAGESKPAAGTTMDWLGVFFIVIAVGALLTALNEGAKLATAFDAGTLTLAIVLTAIAAVAFFAFWSVEKRAKQPMVETVHLRQRSTWAPLLTTTLTMTGIFAVINGIVPAYVQAADPGFGVGPHRDVAHHPDPLCTAWLAVRPHQRPPGACPRLHQGPAHRPCRQPRGTGHHRVLRTQQPAHDDRGHGLAGHHVRRYGQHHAERIGRGSLAPPGNPGFLPGMNAGAFNLGAGLSFLVLPAVLVATSTLNDDKASYLTVVVVGLAITFAAFAASLLIPKPVDAEVTENDKVTA